MALSLTSAAQRLRLYAAPSALVLALVTFAASVVVATVRPLDLPPLESSSRHWEERFSPLPLVVQFASLEEWPTHPRSLLGDRTDARMLAGGWDMLWRVFAQSALMRCFSERSRMEFLVEVGAAGQTESLKVLSTGRAAVRECLAERVSQFRWPALDAGYQRRVVWNPIRDGGYFESVFINGVHHSEERVFLSQHSLLGVPDVVLPALFQGE